MKKFAVIIAILMTLFLSISKSAAYFSPKERLFLIEERILVKNLPEDLRNLSVWIPYPVNDNWQAIEDFKFAAPFKPEVIMDKEYGNRVFLFKFTPLEINHPEAAAAVPMKSWEGGFLTGLKKDITYSLPLQIVLSFKVKRMEYGPFGNSDTLPKNLPRFLRADRLVPVNGEIKKLAEEITQGKNDDLEKARAIYDYIIDELAYSKDDPKVCGIGDSLLTLEFKKGICTDYHSLFISLARSLGIPAKFEIGFPISSKKEGKINGYHCWAKFYLKDKGWIPVDISEADKHPEKKDYFFGRIDENRIHLTTGRDINLEYAQSSQALNFFVYPYIELDGKQFNNIDIEIRYKDLEGGV